MSERQTHPRYSFRSTGLSDVGAKRKVNEDSFIVNDAIGLWAVADGAGGHEAGDVASAMVVSELAKICRPLSGGQFIDDIQAAILAAHTEMQRYAAATSSVSRIASTVACLVAYEGFFACFWVGDSRIYRLRDGVLERMSSDHSLVQELIDRGELTEAEVPTHSQRSVITRAVGVGDDLQIDLISDRLQPGDVFLVCSDGLTGSVSDGLIERNLRSDPAQRAAETILQDALQGDAKDNITLIVIECMSA